jgi:hypothetical protein
LEPAYLYGGRLIAISPLGVGMVRKTKAHVAWHTRHKNQYGGKIKKRKVEKKRKEKIERRMGGNARGKTITSLGVIRKGI